MARRQLLNYIGIGILLLGIGTGTYTYRHSDPSNDDEEVADSIYDSRVYQRNVEMYSGTFGLVMDQWRRGFEKLGRPRPLSIILIVVSTLAAGGCLLAASGMPRE